MNLIAYVSDAVTDNFVTRYVRGYSHGPSSPPSSPHDLSMKPPAWAGQLVRSGGIFVRLAGLSGALAVALGAYGAHALFKRDDIPEELKEAYDRANHYHFLHTLALLGVPLTRRPALVSSCVVLLLCQTCLIGKKLALICSLGECCIISMNISNINTLAMVPH